MIKYEIVKLNDNSVRVENICDLVQSLCRLKEVQEFVLDMSNVNSMNDVSFGVILRLDRELCNSKKRLYLTDLRNEVNRLIDYFGVRKTLNIFPTTSDYLSFRLQKHDTPFITFKYQE